MVLWLPKFTCPFISNQAYLNCLSMLANIGQRCWLWNWVNNNAVAYSKVYTEQKWANVKLNDQKLPKSAYLIQHVTVASLMPLSNIFWTNIWGPKCTRVDLGKLHCTVESWGDSRKCLLLRSKWNSGLNEFLLSPNPYYL